MATNSPTQLQKLQAENKRLRQANEELRSQAAVKNATHRRQPIRKIAVILCLSVAVTLLVLGNLFFWTANTVVKTDRYVAATSPIIENPEVQKALATKATQKLFERVDIDQLTEEALPPRAAFLAPQLADQIQQKTQSTIEDIVARPQFHDRWNGAQERAHSRLIGLAQAHGSDGSIDISEIYQDISQQLSNTKLSFLADKPLPDKVGSIQLVSGHWLSVLQNTIQNIDTWRAVSIGLLVLVSGLGIWLSRNRRRTVTVLSGLFATSMFLTVMSIRLAREVLASHVDPQYAEATRQAYSIFMHSLVVQTFTILGVALVSVFIAWISGSSSSSRATKRKIDQLFSGKLHKVLFSKENSFTMWVGAHKATLQWLTIVLVAIRILFTRLTPEVLLAQIIVVLLLAGAIELLAAKPKA